MQDDYRVSRSLLLSAGVRFGAQEHVSNAVNLSPRGAPRGRRSGTAAVTLRGSYGYFYDWIADDLYKQSLAGRR